MPIIPVDGIDDPRLADYRIVKEPDLAERRGLFVAEGRLVVERLVASKRFEVASLLVTDASRTALAAPLVGLDPAIPIFVVPHRLVETITGFNLHRGCLALGRRPIALGPQTALAGARRVLVIDSVTDADNVGGLFRNAWAFGIDAVLLSPTTCDPLYRKAIRTSMAGTLMVPFARAVAWPAGLDELEGGGLPLISLSPATPPMALSEFVRSGRADQGFALVVGAEGSGVSASVDSRAAVRVRIPMRPGVDSLNVAVAAGIALAALCQGDPLD